MQKFQKVFGSQKCSIIGMIHLRALPGTPNYDGNFNQIIEQAMHETNIYQKCEIDALLIENMHDVPYVCGNRIGWEIVSSMTRICSEIKKLLSLRTPCGIQILASANRQALAVAKATDLQFIRAEGFVFSHIADEGFTDACAGDILRYRKTIDAENILILTDVKKKHSSHSITDDVSLIETIHAAEFFLSDGVILTGTATGCAVNVNELNSIHKKFNVPILMGSGVTKDNINQYFDKSNAAIIGSHFKRNGQWDDELSESKVSYFMDKVRYLRNNVD